MNLTVGPARAEERAAAFRLYFQNAAAEDLQGRVDRGLELIASGEMGPDGVIVCRDGQHLVGVMVALVLQGAAALLWPPQTSAGHFSTEVEDRLVEFAVAWLRLRGCKFAQALVNPQELKPSEPLQRHGFPQVTTLQYLEKTLEPGCQEPEGTSLIYTPYSIETAGLFQKILLASYQDALDCPELNSVRTGEEIIAGYLAVPGSRADRWWLAWLGAEPVGVLIPVEMQGMPTWELLYVGLVPDARRRGLGAELTRKAMSDALAAGAERMTLTVDRRNEPALRLYARLGFEEFDRREVFLKVFGD